MQKSNIILTFASMMRKAPLMAVLLLVLASCSGRKTLADYELSLDSIVVDTFVSVSKDANAPRCTLHLNVKVFSGPNAEQMNDSVLRGGILPADYLSLTDDKIPVREAVDSFIKRYFTDYRAFYGKVYAEESGAGTADLSYRVDTKVEMLRSGTINYLASITDQSGASATTYTLVHNLDAETGRILHLWDLFGSDQLSTLGQDIGEALASQLELSDTIALREQGYFVHTPFYAPDNYLVDDDGVVFIFVPGEITMKEEGEIRVKF